MICFNYGLTFVLSNLEKILEKRVAESMIPLTKTDFSTPFNCQHYSTSYTLLYMIEMIMKALDDGNFACGIFVNLQKAFDTVNHNILLSKLSPYGIRGIANKWFKSYMSKQSSSRVCFRSFAFSDLH